MSYKLGFKKHFRIEIYKKELLVFLLSEIENFVLKGQLYTELAPLLDGTKDMDEIVDGLISVISPAEIYYALEVMKQKGYITELEYNLPERELAYWHQMGITDKEIKEKLANTTVYLKSFSSIDMSSLLCAIKSLGINVVKEEKTLKDRVSGTEIFLYAVDDYLQQELCDINRKALQNNQTWMIMKPMGSIIWIGPIFIPGITGCWECLAQRLRTKRDIHLFIQTKKESSEPLIISLGSLPPTVEIACQAAAQQIALWVMKKEDSLLSGKVISLNTTTLKSEEHILVKRPQCPLCGNEKTSLKPVTLKNQKKNFILGSGHRTLSAEETFRKYSHHISNITGVVDSLIPGYIEENDIIHVYFAGHNSAMKQQNVSTLEKHLRNLNAGKGTTDIQAKTGALCEAIERYCGLFQGDEQRELASYRKIKDKAILPDDCMNYSKEQYKNRDFTNPQAHHFQIVPLPFDEEIPVEWTPVWSLTRQEYRYVISSYCYYGYPYPEGHFFSWPNSNGCASGNTIEEAILQGFFELVERDAVGIWWYNKIVRPAVNMESFNIAYVLKLKEFYEKHNRHMWVIDITTDLGIPTFVAMSRRIKGEPEEIVFAFGSHFDPSVALLRAVTEMNQFMPHMFSGTPGEYTYKDKSAVSWWKTARLAENPYLAPGSEEKKFSDYENISSDDLLTDIKICQKIIEDLGMELLVMDQTKPDVGLNVAKVIVPGMRHMWQRVGPGRLYEVPVKMGWLKKQKKEAELNQIAIFV